MSLLKFEFSSYSSYKIIKLEDLKLFFDNWKDRNPMLLKIECDGYTMYEKQELEDLTEKYKAKGIIKQYSICIGKYIYEDFEWI